MSTMPFCDVSLPGAQSARPARFAGGGRAHLMRRRHDTLPDRKRPSGGGVPIKKEFYENAGEPAGDPGLTFTAFTHTILQDKESGRALRTGHQAYRVCVR